MNEFEVECIETRRVVVTYSVQAVDALDARELVMSGYLTGKVTELLSVNSREVIGHECLDYDDDEEDNDD